MNTRSLEELNTMLDERTKHMVIEEKDPENFWEIFNSALNECGWTYKQWEDKMKITQTLSNLRRKNRGVK